MINLFRSIRNNRIPGQLVIQITDSCNARCPQCGMRATEGFARSTLETDIIKRAIDAAAQKGVHAISFTGGEPLLDIKRLVELINYAGKASIPFIRTGTNGFMFRHPEKKDFESRVTDMVEQLAATPLRNFWISLDSAVDSVHEQMRGFPNAVAGIARALPIFHRAGIYPAVNLGINRNVGGPATRNLSRSAAAGEAAYLRLFYNRYRCAFARFYRRVIDLGFTMANTCYPMSVDEPASGDDLNAVYAATSVTDIIRFTPAEKRMLFKALASVIRQFRSRIRIFSPLCSTNALIKQYSGSDPSQATFGCRGGVDFFFINAADGNTYPCGYRGNENLGRIEDLDIDGIIPSENSKACRQCDWECFRDPSELFGPILEIMTNPQDLIRRAASDPQAMTAWAKDLSYYWACDFFHGRRPPNYARLHRFSSKAAILLQHQPQDFNRRRFNQKLSVS